MNYHDLDVRRNMSETKGSGRIIDVYETNILIVNRY